jgi:hypothetical protein
MDSSQLINATYTGLKPLVEAQGGGIQIAESQEAALKFLEAAPNRWRIILFWEGFGSHPQAREGLTSHQVATLIQQPTGLNKKPGEILTNPLPSGAQPFSKRIQQVIGWMTSMRFPDGTNADPAGYALDSSQWVPAATGTQAHVISWKLDAALPHYDLTIPLVFPHLTPTP